MSAKSPDLPTEIFFVQAIPDADETIPYYGRVLTRLYRNLRGAQSFINGNTHKSGRTHKVWRAKVTEWEEIDAVE